MIVARTLASIAGLGLAACVGVTRDSFRDGASWSARFDPGSDSGEGSLVVAGTVDILEDAEPVLAVRSPPSINPSILELDLLAQPDAWSSKGQRSARYVRRDVSFSMPTSASACARTILVFHQGRPRATLRCRFPTDHDVAIEQSVDPSLAASGESSLTDWGTTFRCEELEVKVDYGSEMVAISVLGFSMHNGTGIELSVPRRPDPGAAIQGLAVSWHSDFGLPVPWKDLSGEIVSNRASFESGSEDDGPFLLHFDLRGTFDVAHGSVRGHLELPVPAFGVRPR